MRGRATGLCKVRGGGGGEVHQGFAMGGRFTRALHQGCAKEGGLFTGGVQHARARGSCEGGAGGFTRVAHEAWARRWVGGGVCV